MVHPGDTCSPLHAGEAHQGRPGQARALYGLLGALLEAPALRQGALIVLAVSCELVPRAWFSHLKVLPRLWFDSTVCTVCTGGSAAHVAWTLVRHAPVYLAVQVVTHLRLHVPEGVHAA